MSEFNIILFAAGAVLIVVVLIFELLQMRRSTKTKHESEVDDWQMGSTPGTPRETVIPNLVADSLHPSDVERFAFSEFDKALSEKKIDPLIDCICPLSLSEPWSGQTLIAHLPIRESIGGKTFLIEGRNIRTGVWERVQEDIEYDEIHLAIQLINRDGPINEIACSEFNATAFHLAEKLDCNAQLPDMVDMIEQAQFLQTFTEHCNQVLTLNLRTTGEPWSAEAISNAAKLENMLVDHQHDSPDEIRFHLLDENSQPMLMLSANTQPPEIALISLMLYVPIVRNDLEPFEHMVELSERLKFQLSAELVDDQGTPLTEIQLKSVKNKLNQLYENMSVQGILPGSDTARRLFQVDPPSGAVIGITQAFTFDRITDSPPSPTMTYCVAIKTHAGLVFLSDSRTNAGLDHVSTYRKSIIFEKPNDRFMVLMTAGNLSVSQSVRESLQTERIDEANTDEPITIWNATTMFDAARVLGSAIRRVYRRDSESLQQLGVEFSASMILGGQIRGEAMRLFLVYAAGNFIETTDETPYVQIGESKYGKPVLDRVITPNTPLDQATKCALVSMDSTIKSNLSVGLPLDLIVYENDQLLSDQVVCIDESNPYFQMLHSSWGDKLAQAFESIEVPDWRQNGSTSPLVVNGDRYQTLIKIASDRQKLV